jgi:signal transduction histidine kinase
MTGPLELSSSVRLDDQLDSEVPSDIGEDMLHALREALSNAARHGKATQVEVSVAVGGELRLLVRDNGVGIGETGHRSGLANLARRAEQHGGTLTVTPAAGGGTELDWRVPLGPSRP